MVRPFDDCDVGQGRARLPAVFLRAPFRHAPHAPCLHPVTRTFLAFGLDVHLRAGDNVDHMRTITLQNIDSSMKQLYGREMEGRNKGELQDEPGGWMFDVEEQGYTVARMAQSPPPAVPFLVPTTVLSDAMRCTHTNSPSII